MPRKTYTPVHCDLAGVQPFQNAEEVWFWFVQANQAKLDGARISATASKIKRPCEPIDILRIMDRLHRDQRLTIEHFKVLRFYGLRQEAPDPWRPREAKAALLWREALRSLEDRFVQKKIVVRPDVPRDEKNLISIDIATERLARRWNVNHDYQGAY